MIPKVTYRRRHRNQGGVFAVLTALVLLTLFAFFGVAVDSGHLYSVQAQMQRTADVGVVGGADTLKWNQWATVDYQVPGDIDSGQNGPGNTSATACTSWADKALESASLNGYGVADSTSSNPCGVPDHSYCYGQYYSGGGMGVPTSSNQSLSNSQYDIIFYDNSYLSSTNGQPVQPGNCSAADISTGGTRATSVTQIELLSPPKVSDIAPGSDCSTFPDNCMEEIIIQKEQNYVMQAFGMGSTTIRVLAVGYGL